MSASRDSSVRPPGGSRVRCHWLRWPEVSSVRIARPIMAGASWTRVSADKAAVTGASPSVTAQKIVDEVADSHAGAPPQRVKDALRDTHGQASFLTTLTAPA